MKKYIKIRWPRFLDRILTTDITMHRTDTVKVDILPGCVYYSLAFVITSAVSLRSHRGEVRLVLLCGNISLGLSK